MQIDFAFLADSANVRPDGRIDAIAIGAFIATEERFPASLQHFAVVTRVGFAEEDGDTSGLLRVGIIAPDGTTVSEQESVVEAPPIILTMTEGRKRTRVLNFYDVPLPSPGPYACRITLNERDEYRGIHFDAALAVPAK